MSNAAMLRSFLRSESLPIRARRGWHPICRVQSHRELFEALECRELLSDTPTHLVIGVDPNNGYTGLKNAVALTVEVTDGSGSIVTTDHSVVKLSIASGPAGALHGTVAVRAVHGVATFSDLVFSKVGMFTLTASDGALATATTDSISIVAAPTPTSLEFTQPPLGDLTGAVVSGPVAVEVMDQYGNPYSGPEVVSLNLSSGPARGKIGGTLHAKTIAGTATFNAVTVNEGGSFVLEAKLGKLTALSDPFDMGGPPVATTLEFVQQPTDATAGQKISPPVAVEVLDQYNNILTTNHSTITLKLQGGPAHAPVYTANVKLGVATFAKLTYDSAGAFTLAASDRGLATVASDSFTISAAAATHLAFAAIPANTSPSAGPLTVVVDAVDKFGNVDTTSTATVTIALAAEPHGAGPESSSIAAVDGVATFDGLVFPEAGRYVLKATGTGLTGVLSHAFTLT